MTPDTAALRAQIRANEDAAAFYGGTPNRIILDPDTVRALCDAADEVERLRLDAETAWSEHGKVQGDLAEATDEVERLRGDRDALREQVQRLRASRESNRGGWARTLTERDALRAAVDRVRALGERDGRDLLAAWLASNGVEQPDTVAVEAAAFVLTALESGNYGTPEWFNSIDKPLFPEGEVIREATDASRTAHAALVAGIETGLRESACAECDHDRCATYRSAASWVRDYAALDRHAPTTGATP